MSALPNNQFQIPPSANEHFLVTPADALPVPATPEEAPSALEALKQTERFIFALREAALAQPTPEPTGWLRAAKLRIARRPLTQHDLINQESYCGGSIVHTNSTDRFWLDIQTPATQQSGAADWYFAQSVAGPQGSAPEMQVIRFQTTPENIHKLYAGREVPLGDDEKNAFLETVAAYKNAVTTLYQSLDKA